MKKFLITLLAVLISAVGVVASSTPTLAASAGIRVTGKIKGVDAANSAIMLLAHDGTSIRVPLETSGKFSINVPKKISKKFATTTKGRGATLHVLTNGEYNGPVVLRKSSNKKGHTRLSPNIKGKINVGTLTMKTGFALGRVKTTLVDSTSSVRLKAGAPVSTASTNADRGTHIVGAFAALTGDASSLGADADRDGLPNVADPDMNGDNLPDAAQPESTTAFEGLNNDLVLSGRPESDVVLAKILDLESPIQVNSNANPSVTEEQIRAALAAGMKIQIARIGIPQSAGTSVFIDCRKLSYCELGSKSMVRGAPGDPIDGKSLFELQNADGLIEVPVVTSPSGSYEARLTVYPGIASTAEGNLAGDVFDMITKVNGVITSASTKVVTSSVATPMALISFGGSPVTSPRGETAVSITSTSAIPVEFYRPQSFAKGSTSTLLDRGGLTYFVSIWPQDNTNTGYPCQVKHYSTLSSTLLKSPTSLPPVEQGMFDSEVSPTANGKKLSFTLDAAQCLNDQTNRKHSLVSGAEWRMELMGQDSDGNKVNVKTLFRIP